MDRPPLTAHHPPLAHRRYATGGHRASFASSTTHNDPNNTTIMNLQPHIIRTLLQALLFAAAILLSIATHAQVQMAFSGHVVMPDPGPHDVTMTVVNGTDTTTMAVRPNGAFSFFKTVEDGATVTVSCPGYITKEVVFNTAGAGNMVCTEQVRFNVVMERQPVAQEVAYAAPVGSIDLTATRRGCTPHFRPVVPGTVDRHTVTAAR